MRDHINIQDRDLTDYSNANEPPLHTPRSGHLLMRTPCTVGWPYFYPGKITLGRAPPIPQLQSFSASQGLHPIMRNIASDLPFVETRSSRFSLV